jgi:hypothetical protein
MGHMIRHLAYLFAFSLIATGCFNIHISPYETIHGNGDVITEERSVPYFSSVRITGARTTVLYGDSDGPILMTGESNILDHTLSYVENEILYITSEKRTNMRPNEEVFIEIPGRYVNEVHVSGSNNITLQNIDQPTFRVRGSGSTEVTATGFADELEIRMSGSSEIDAGALSAEIVTIRTSGSSEAIISADEAIVSRSSGSSSIRYYGQPATIENHSSGSSSLRSAW